MAFRLLLASNFFRKRLVGFLRSFSSTPHNHAYKTLTYSTNNTNTNNKNATYSTNNKNATYSTSNKNPTYTINAQQEDPGGNPNQGVHIYTGDSNGDSKDSKFNMFFKYFSVVTFSLIVGIDLITESKSHKVSSVYVAIREKKPDVAVIGRDQEVEMMRKAFRSSHASTWLITGPGGCGKSDLVRHAMSSHPFSLYLNVRDFVGREVNATVVVERFNEVIGLPTKGLFASILAWAGRGSEPIASSQFAESLSILADALNLVHHPESMTTLMKIFIRFKSYGRELNPLPDSSKPIPCPVVVMDEGQVLSSPMFSSTGGGTGTVLMSSLASVTSVDMSLAHFVIVSNEATQLRRLLKETSTLNSVWVREMSISDVDSADARKFVINALKTHKFGISSEEITRISDLILEHFGGRLGDLNAILSIHMLEGMPIEEAIHSLWNVRYHDIAEILSAIPDNGETDALKLVKMVINKGTISHREAVQCVNINVLHYLVHEGILHRYLVPNTQFTNVTELPFYTVASTFTQKILENKFITP